MRFFGALVVARLKVVIIDEAHASQFAGTTAELASHESRALRLEALISRLKAARPDARFIAISAVAQNLAGPLGRWISAEAQPEAITVPYRSTRQVIGRLEYRSTGATRIAYDLLDGSPVRVGEGSGSAPFVPQPFPLMPPTPGLDGVMQRAAAIALWAAAHSAAAGDAVTDGQSVLVSVAEQIGNHASWWLKLLDEIWTDTELPRFFTEPEEEELRDLRSRALASCSDLFGPDSREYRLLGRGIVMHHGRMPGRLTRYMTELIEARICRIVMATSTLSEGVNLPFSTVLVPGLMRYSSGTRLSGREFANLAGRAGRPGVSTEGQTLAIIPLDGPRTVVRDYNSILQEILGAANTGALPRSAIATLIRHLVQLFPEGEGPELTTWLESTAPLDVTTNIADEPLIASLDSLDALLIAVLEDATEAEAEEALLAFWRATFAHFASADEEALSHVFATRGRAVARVVYADNEARARIYRTSLPPRDAQVLFAVVPSLMEHLRTGSAYSEWDGDERLRYVLRAVELLGAVSKFRVPERVGKSKATREDALRWWFQVPQEGSRKPTISQLAQWHDFLQQELRYRFTWGLGAALALESEDDGSPAAAPVPSAALWIKDLLTWGTLDPAAAYFLARGLAHTRPEAHGLAIEYYDDADSQGDPHDPSRLRIWAARRTPRQPSQAIPTRFAASVVERMSDEARARTYRVLPHVSPGDSTSWLDPSGAILAESRVHPRVMPDPVEFDFVLSPQEAVVTAYRYA